MARLHRMVSSSRLLHRLSLGRWLLGLWLVMANVYGWACADPAAGAGQRIGLWPEPAAVAPAPDRVAHGAMEHGADRVPGWGLAWHGTPLADHPCGHGQAVGGAALGSDPCASPASPCAGLCAAVCLAAAGAGLAWPFTPAGLPANGRAEACPQLSGWTGTGRSVPPESPPPIV